MTINTITLSGCTPTPLAGYLKALGVLRLVASPSNNATGEAADSEVRGFWESERFHLRTRLNIDMLMRFFLEDYVPSPLIGAWNGRGGFLEDEDSERSGAELIRRFEESRATRFASIQESIARLRDEPLLVRYSQLRKAEKNEKNKERKKVLKKESAQVKKDLLPHLRSNTDSRHLALVDAAWVVGDESRAAPLLGSGFNDGSRDFGVNFLEKIGELFSIEDGKPTNRSSVELKAALLNSTERVKSRGTMGQFGPGQGGANATTGYVGKNPLNPWDVICTLEGAILWSGALTCRWGTRSSTGKAAFPFTYESNIAGSGALSVEDPNTPRGEIWTPLWSGPSSLIEIESLFAEGRITLGRRIAQTGLDAARAVTQLGISRGIEAFERYSIIQPDIQMPCQATPLGRFKASAGLRQDIVSDLDAGGWLNQVRSRARDKKNASTRARVLVKRLEDALFAMTETNVNPLSVQGALGALGDLVGWMTTSRDVLEKRLRPPPRLSDHWVREADDKTAEYRVAAALASLGWQDGSDQQTRVNADAPETTPHQMRNDDSDPDLVVANEIFSENRPNDRIALAAHFAPIDLKTIYQRLRRWDMANKSLAVWGAGGFQSNLVAVLERRLIEQSVRSLEDKLLDASAPARLDDIAAFLEPDFDDARCARLLAGLVWAKPASLRFVKKHRSIVPFAYAVLKPVVTSNRILVEAKLVPPKLPVPTPPGLVARLRSGNVNTAIRLAFARMRASGVTSLFDSTTIAHVGMTGTRLAAALLIPLDHYGLKTLIKRAYPQKKEFEDVA